MEQNAAAMNFEKPEPTVNQTKNSSGENKNRDEKEEANGFDQRNDRAPLSPKLANSFELFCEKPDEEEIVVDESEDEKA